MSALMDIVNKSEDGGSNDQYIDQNHNRSSVIDITGQIKELSKKRKVPDSGSLTGPEYCEICWALKDYCKYKQNEIITNPDSPYTSVRQLTINKIRKIISKMDARMDEK